MRIKLFNIIITTENEPTFEDGFNLCKKQNKLTALHILAMLKVLRTNTWDQDLITRIEDRIKTIYHD